MRDHLRQFFSRQLYEEQQWKRGPAVTEMPALRIAITAPVGEPLLHGSNLEYVYISLPYTFGPELEICTVGNEDIHLYWVFPITREEKEFAKTHGYEELQRRFEKAGVEYWSPNRKSVISEA